MSEHLRHLSRHARDARVLHAQRRPADADQGRRVLPADARGARRRARPVHPRVRPRPRRRLLRHDARAPRPVVERGRRPCRSQPRRPRPEPGVASLYQHVPFRQDTSYLSIGERTNANGSKAFREAMLEPRWDDCVEIARDQTRDGAHLLDVCIDYVGRDGVADMQRGRRPARHRVDAAARARLDRAGRDRGRPRAARRPRRRSTRSTTRTATGPTSRFARDHAGRPRARRRRRRADHRRGGPGPHRRVQGARSPTRLIDDLTGEWGMRVEDIVVDCLTFPIATGQEETRRDASRRSRRSARSSGATPRCRPRSACPTSRSASTRPPASC